MPATSPAKRHRREGTWATLRRQYAPAGYLGWLGHELSSSVVRRRNPESWDDQLILAEINARGPGLRDASGEKLQSLSHRLREEARSGRPLAQYVAPAFALVRESSRRVLNLFHHEVQILAGLAMCRGAIAEMATGEGKTLVQSLAAYARALAGKGVHVATANAYLAERDQEFAQPLYDFLGLTSALLPEKQSTAVKRVAYAADVTYGTGTEFGFDYLRDQLELFKMPKPRLGDRFSRAVLGENAAPLPGLAQRGLSFAIIDEVDSILIDEASTPLVISTRKEGPHGAPAPFLVARDLASRLEQGVDFFIESGAIRLSPEGEARIQSGEFPVPWADLRRPWGRYVENALRASLLLKRDVTYIVQDGKAVIIDEFTGRARPESSWRDGLHQAVEADAGIEISSESESAASISRQRFFRLYDAIAGMTGTAMTAAGEFWEIFRLPVISIPRHKPSRAVFEPHRVFTSEKAKFLAVVEDISRRHQAGQPVLVGSRTIRNSEIVSTLLTASGIPHKVLNARQDSEEAAIISAAGEPGAVTIATNMAGRGTHIALGTGVEALGGLHVISLEMEESRRIDLQLTGRTARQGRAGSSQMFLSAEDHLLARHYPNAAQRLSEARCDERGEVKPTSWVQCFEKAQHQAERSRYESRIALMHRDEWLTETKRRLG